MFSFRLTLFSCALILTDLLSVEHLPTEQWAFLMYHQMISSVDPSASADAAGLGPGSRSGTKSFSYGRSIEGCLRRLHIAIPCSSASTSSVRDETCSEVSELQPEVTLAGCCENVSDGTLGDCNSVSFACDRKPLAYI